MFDPKTNTWTAMSNQNAPEGRFAHTAVWTGSKMIIWGGLKTFTERQGNGGTYGIVPLSSGGIYSP
jgi:hypothetical protein